MITAGIDSGSGNTKALILGDGRILAKAKTPTGFDFAKAAASTLAAALADAGLDSSAIHRVFGTGAGRRAVQAMDGTIDDIQAMAGGAVYLFPEARTVIDVGAEESRSAKVDDKGAVVDAIVNERCAAGAGIFIESMARTLEIPLEAMGPLALTSDQNIPINAQCAVFAESEVVGLIHAGTAKSDISKAIHDAMAGRIADMIRRIGINPEVVLMGGVGYNPAILAILKRQLGLATIRVPEAPEYGAALGAALAATQGR